MHSSDGLPPEIDVDELAGDGVRYRLPRRQFVGLRGMSLALIGFGLMGLVFMGFWVSGFAGGFQQLLGPLGLLSGLFAVPGFVGAASAVGVGVALLYGHAEIEVADGEIHSVERVGGFHWTRSRKVDDIRRLAVTSFNSGSERTSTAENGSISKFDAFLLQATLANGKNFWLTFAYPREWLFALAQKLALDCHATSNEAGAPAIEVEVIDVATDDPGEINRREQPENSKIVYEPLPDGLTLNVPARGLWRGSAGLFAFGLLWCGFTGVLSFFMVPTKSLDFGLMAFLAIFWGSGVGMLLVAANMGYRRAGLAVADGKLMILQTGIFGSKTKEWHLDDLKTIRVGPSGMTVNDVPVMELQVVPLAGKPFGMLAGRDLAEIEWISTLLRDATTVSG